jgi:hypothetical protein
MIDVLSSQLNKISFWEVSAMRVVLSMIAFVALQATSAFAQNAMPACSGDIAIVRVSEIKPGGSMEGFMAALAAHKAWYRANGITDNVIVASRVVVRDKTTGAEKYSDTEVITYHIRPPASARTPHRGDAAWNAYVKQYRDNSDIKAEYVTCMPKLDP